MIVFMTSFVGGLALLFVGLLPEKESALSKLASFFGALAALWGFSGLVFLLTAFALGVQL